MGLVGYYRDLLTPMVEGRKLILAGLPLAGATGMVREARDLGAAGVFIVANQIGAGELPREDEATWVVLDLDAATVMDVFRQTRAALEDPPENVRRALNAWDPGHEAMVLGDAFYTRRELAGRPVYGNRRPEWETYEDKVVVDVLWDGAGVGRAPSLVVAAEPTRLRAAATELDAGSGTAWAGDAREGFNGAAEYLRWVRNGDDLAEAIAFFTEHCDRVRVMPFLEGIPCSIHGMVFPRTVIALRPCEMITLRPTSGNRLRYVGAATFWDPPEADRIVMRDIARRVGSHLADLVGFRGGFTVDGVLTKDGFLPTELNTRPGGGLAGMLDGLTELPLGMIQRAVVELEPFDYRTPELEDLIVTSADAHRGGGVNTVVQVEIDETIMQPLKVVDGGYAPIDDTDGADATLLLGPGAVGGIVRFAPLADRTPAGPSLATRAVAALALADRLWNTRIGRLQPARSVR